VRLFSNPPLAVGESVFYLTWGILHHEQDEGRWVCEEGVIEEIIPDKDRPQFRIEGRWYDFVYREKPKEYCGPSIRWIQYQCPGCDVMGDMTEAYAIQKRQQQKVMKTAAQVIAKKLGGKLVEKDQ